MPAQIREVMRCKDKQKKPVTTGSYKTDQPASSATATTSSGTRGGNDSNRERGKKKVTAQGCAVVRCKEGTGKKESTPRERWLWEAPNLKPDLILIKPNPRPSSISCANA